MATKVSKTISVLAGDGIGPEIMQEAIKVLDQIGTLFQHKFTFKHALIGGAAYDVHKNHCPKETLETCRESDAVLFGSVGGPLNATSNPNHPDHKKFHNSERNSLLGLRSHFNFAVNVRPVKVYPQLAHLSPVKDEFLYGSKNENEKVLKNCEFNIVRELVGDVYFGEHSTAPDFSSATDVMHYTADQIRKPLLFAFNSIDNRINSIISNSSKSSSTKANSKGKVTLVDKANVLDTSRLWRKIAAEVSKDFPDVELEYMFVDNAAMQLVLNPTQFDVLVTGNLFGDILSDAASVLPGSLGLMPSASLNVKNVKKGKNGGYEYEYGLSMYEPSGGSAPDIAGKNVANPIGQILSAAMMLEYSFNLHTEAKLIHSAVEKVLHDGFRTRDLLSKSKQSQTEEKLLTTTQFGDKIAKAIHTLYTKSN